jgi:hypothetical protein
LERDNRFRVEKADRLEQYLAHVLVGEPASTSPGHALAAKAMLNERQTLTILGWTISSLCIAIFALSAMAMPY